MKLQLTEAEQAWMLELNRIGTEEGMRGFPMQPAVLYGQNDFLLDFEAGLTPREVIERNKPYEPPVQDPNLTDVFKCRSCGTLNALDNLVPKEWPEFCPHCGSDEADLITVPIQWVTK